ncbi:MAG: polymer-forming cytoskeletal protein [Bacteroidales bacterium]|nr:polymer-forming cytoskeletal protein [Bacteroidales bacterium]
MNLKSFTKVVHEFPARNIIGQGTTIKGDIESSGDFRIDGQLTGSIKVGGRLVIGPSGIVAGSMKCQNADISGHVKADMQVDELTAMKSTAVIEGDLETGRLTIEVGAKFRGKCEMIDTTGKPNETAREE